jgi:hypothetical protein
MRDKILRLWRLLDVTPRMFFLYWAFNTVLITFNHYFFNKDGVLPVAHFHTPLQSFHVGLFIAVQSMLVRKRNFWEQICFSVATTSLLELPAYTFGTSVVEPGNFVEQIFGVRNFTLALTMVLSFLIPFNNWVVPLIERTLFGKAPEPSSGTVGPSPS